MEGVQRDRDPHEHPRPTGWLALIRERARRAASDAQGAGAEVDLGAELVRLAKLAAAAHQVERDLDGHVNTRCDVRELHGRSSSLVAPTGSSPHDAGPFRREVER